MDRDELIEAWKTLSDKTLNVAKELSAEADPNRDENKDFYVRLWAIALLCRSVNNFTGMQLLLTDAFIVEARTLVRCCYENLFRVAYLAKKRQAAVHEWLADWDANNRTVGNDLLTWSKNNSKDITTNDEFEKFMSVLNAKKLEKSKFQQEAKVGGMLDGYIAYRMLSRDAAHPSAAVLFRHARSETDGTLTISGAELQLDENEDLDTVALACNALIHVSAGVNEILTLQHGRTLLELHNEHLALDSATLALKNSNE